MRKCTASIPSRIRENGHYGGRGIALRPPRKPSVFNALKELAVVVADLSTFRESKEKAVHTGYEDYYCMNSELRPPRPPKRRNH